MENKFGIDLSYHDRFTAVDKGEMDITPGVLDDFYYIASRLYPKLSDKEYKLFVAYYNKSGWLAPAETNKRFYVLASERRTSTVYLDEVPVRVRPSELQLIAYVRHIAYQYSLIYHNINYVYTKTYDHYYIISGQKIPFREVIARGEECSYCGAVFISTSAHTLFLDDVCTSCINKVGELVREYNYKAEKHFKHKEDSKDILYGIELELEGSSFSALVYADKHLKTHCILKRDGSLQNGVEIVTKPAKVGEHKEAFKPFFDKIDTTSLQAKSSCGMHIHVSKNPLTALQIKRIGGFLEENMSFVHKIAGRKDNTYSKVKDLTKGMSVLYNEREPVYSKRLNLTTSTRYSALNCTGKHTIEFRMFASTTDFVKFIANLEFVQALVEFNTPGNLKISIGKIPTKEMFIEYVTKNRKSYPSFFELMKDIR